MINIKRKSLTTYHAITPSPVGKHTLSDFSRNEVVDDERSRDETSDKTTPPEVGHISNNDLLKHLQTSVAERLI